MTEKKSALKKEVNIKFNNVRAAHYHDNNVWEHRSPLNKRVWRQYTAPPGPRNIFPGSSNNRTTVCSPGSPNDHFIQRSKDGLVQTRHINSDKWRLSSAWELGSVKCAHIYLDHKLVLAISAKPQGGLFVQFTAILTALLFKIQRDVLTAMHNYSFSFKLVKLYNGSRL